ncbi:MAG: Hint domain-containing protein [Tabrizicola sp.]
MPTTFNVFQLGVLPSIDPTEGNQTAENAGALVGLTFGAPGTPLLNTAAVFSPGSFAGGTATAYDMNNSLSNDTFSINGGPLQTFDGTSIYNATITYLDGTTATITAVIFQDTAGNTYWAPEILANADQTVMEAKPIRSLTLDSLSGDTFSGLASDRQPWNYLICYVRGTHILTPAGEVRVEDLRPGDLVVTRDNGPRPIRWIGCSTAPADGKLAPIRIARGALGRGLPHRALMVSRQHRMLLRSPVVERMFGSPEVLVPAVKLLGLHGIEQIASGGEVDYFHLLTDRHEIIFAEGAPSETLLTGPGARQAIGPEGVEEIETLFPGLIDEVTTPARKVVRDARVERLIERHAKHHMSFV